MEIQLFSGCAELFVKIFFVWNTDTLAIAHFDVTLALKPKLFIIMSSWDLIMFKKIKIIVDYYVPYEAGNETVLTKVKIIKIIFSVLIKTKLSVLIFCFKNL
jgi:hypothetical protein